MHCRRARMMSLSVLPVVRLLVVALLVSVSAGMAAHTRAAEATVGSRRVLVCGSRTAIVDITPDRPEGVVTWSWPAATREGWVLPQRMREPPFLLLRTRAKQPRATARQATRTVTSFWHDGSAWLETSGEKALTS